MKSACSYITNTFVKNAAKFAVEATFGHGLLLEAVGRA